MPAALLVLLLASAGTTADAADLTAAAILTRMTAVYSHVSSYSDEGTVTRDESWPWIVWHIVRYGRAHDEFRTAFTRLRGGTFGFTYSAVGDRERRVDNAAELATLSGVSRGASTIEPLLLFGDSRAPTQRLTALQRRPDTNVGDRRCFVITGTQQCGVVRASYIVYIDQQTYFLRRVSREVAARGTTSTNTIDYTSITAH